MRKKQPISKLTKNGQKWRRMGNICWFTNLDIEKRHEDMTLFRTYSPENYQNMIITMQLKLLGQPIFLVIITILWVFQSHLCSTTAEQFEIMTNTQQ